ncbi:SEC10/PgrA surface exclusion domain-containing protein [Weissella confusa]|uniref:SEC10/PgrA surface exclusion domain-containing protein n=1 Tax=Weissella confusa TaxID=1583 RepID=UPI001C6F6A2A|nr:SEC10/PgrA surface exclusion domain-containing protein [Weissella confusa]QYU57965.1 SEC10/PgrA surface exclusion domain-containing protein [Weissella confusa]
MHKKMYKSGKMWVVASVFALTGVTGTTVVANADSVSSVSQKEIVAVTPAANKPTDNQPEIAMPSSASVSDRAPQTADEARSSEAAVQHLADKQASVSAASSNVAVAQSNADVANSALNSANNAVSLAQSNVATASSALNSDQTAVSSASNSVQEIQSAITNQPSAIASASSVVNEKSKDVDSVSNALNSANDTLAKDNHQAVTDSQAVNVASSNASLANSSEAAVKSAADKTQAALDQANALQNNAASVIASDKQAVNNAQDKLNQEENKLNNTPTSIAALPVATPAATGSPLTAANTIQEVNQLPDKLVRPDNADAHEYDPFYSNWYSYDGSAGLDDSDIIATSGMTEAQQQDLANYELTLINWFRAQNGLSPLHITNASESAALVEMNKRLATANTKNNHYTSDSYFADNNRGHVSIAQNLGMGQSTPRTMLEAKVQVLNALTAMAYQDGAQDWGHRDNLLIDSNKEYGSTAYTNVFGAYWTPEGDFLMDFYVMTPYAVERSDMTVTDNPYVNQNTGWIANPAYAKQQSVVNQAKTNLANTQNQLTADTAHSKNAAALVEVAAKANSDAQSALNAAIKAANQADSELETAKAKLQNTLKTIETDKNKVTEASHALAIAKDNLANAQKKLALVSDAQALQTELAVRQQALKAANDQLREDETALANAQHNLEDALATQSVQKIAVQKAQNELENAKGELLKAQQDLDKANEAVASAGKTVQDAIDASNKAANTPANNNQLDQQVTGDSNVLKTNVDDTDLLPVSVQRENDSTGSLSPTESSTSVAPKPLPLDVKLPKTGASQKSTNGVAVALLLMSVLSLIGMKKREK